MHTLNELDLVRQRHDEIRREIVKNHFARRTRSAGASNASEHSLVARFQVALRPAPNEASVGDCGG